ncbi:MAG: hypothetical protein LBE48_03120 [Methanomassiliicoccaceae archaeon]|jgi:hypothetical protein|nr:hypothetical protein [Methanomassiliicoccaceae archaeon]
MASAREKVLIATAVAVTAVICIYGMYLLVGDTEEKQDVRVTVPTGLEDEAALFFEGFETYTMSKIIISSVDDPKISLLNNGADIIFSYSSSGTAPMKELTIADGIVVYAYYKENTQGMAGSAINWLNGQ